MGSAGVCIVNVLNQSLVLRSTFLSQVGSLARVYGRTWRGRFSKWAFGTQRIDVLEQERLLINSVAIDMMRSQDPGLIKTQQNKPFSGTWQ